MKGASVRDWWWIKNFDLLSEKLAIYNRESKTLSSVHEYKIPWPIVWVCTRYSRKHIFAKRKLPDLRWMHEELNQFCDKMKWRWIFRHDPSPQPSVRFSLNSRCSTPVDAGLQFWLDNFRRRMVCTACSGLKKLKWQKDCWSNVTPLVRLGFKMLKSSQWKPLPTDKTGSYVLVLKEEEKAIHEEVFSKSMYDISSADNIVVDELYKNYFAVAKQVELLTGDKHLGAQLRKSVYMEGARLASLLTVTVKTTKPQGAVSCRNLHCSSRYAFKGLGLWLQCELASKLRPFSHIVQSPQEFSDRIRRANIILDESFWMMKVDIREFFVCGSLVELECEVMKLFDTDPNHKRVVARSALNLLLGSQIIRSKATPLVGRAVEGSGMGLPQSAGIADAAFLCKVEQHMLQTRVVLAAGIKLYMRYRDDIFILTNNRTGTIAWFNKMREKGGFFKLQCEDCQRFNKLVSTEMTFLQFRVQMNHKSKKIRLIPYDKNTAVPLDVSSAHPPATHRWPVNHVLSVMKLATDKDASVEAREAVVHKFKQNLTQPELLAQMMSVNPLAPRKTQNGKISNAIVWIPLSWHPLWQSVRFQRVLSELSKEPFASLIREAFCKDLVFRIAWRNKLMYSAVLMSKL